MTGGRSGNSGEIDNSMSAFRDGGGLALFATRERVKAGDSQTDLEIVSAEQVARELNRAGLKMNDPRPGSRTWNLTNGPVTTKWLSLRFAEHVNSRPRVLRADPGRRGLPHRSAQARPTQLRHLPFRPPNRRQRPRQSRRRLRQHWQTEPNRNQTPRVRRLRQRNNPSQRQHLLITLRRSLRPHRPTPQVPRRRNFRSALSSIRPGPNPQSNRRKKTYPKTNASS
jgi:hypothetical protein